MMLRRTFLKAGWLQILGFFTNPFGVGSSVFDNFDNLTSWNNIEDFFKNRKLVDIQSVNPSIKVNLKYSTTDNFLGKDVYWNLSKAYLHKSVANKLSEAQKSLEQEHPWYSILVYDASRPLSIQKKMRDKVKGTNKQKYVADPSKWGMHNYGCAVDITIVDKNWTPLDMGTEFDDFSSKSHPGASWLTKSQKSNRDLLRFIMVEAWFIQSSMEWWHFDAYSKEYIREHYRILDDTK